MSHTPTFLYDSSGLELVTRGGTEAEEENSDMTATHGNGTPLTLGTPPGRSAWLQVDLPAR